MMSHAIAIGAKLTESWRHLTSILHTLDRIKKLSSNVEQLSKLDKEQLHFLASALAAGVELGKTTQTESFVWNPNDSREHRIHNAVVQWS